MIEFSSEKRKAVYSGAIERYGPRVQMLKAIEEMGELIQAICKLFQTPGYVEPDSAVVDAIAEETADVTITLEQLRMILGIHDEVCIYMDEKVRRLAERLNERF